MRVSSWPGQGCRRPVHHADHLELVPVHLDPLADRVLVGQQLLLHVLADHHDRHVMQVLRSVKKRPAFIVVPPAA